MTTVDQIVFRDGAASDREAVSALQVASWRDSYRGLLPDAYLDGALAEDLTATWGRKLEGGKLVDGPGRHSLLLLAESDRQLEGFIYACPDPKRPDSAYIDNLHVAPDQRGAGLGTRLLRQAAKRLALQGYYGAYLRVFVANEAAVRFYLRLGAHITRRETDDLMGYPADTYRLEWPDLSALI